MGSAGTLWFRLRQQLHEVCALGRGEPRPPRVHEPPPPLRILSWGLSGSQGDLLRLALAESQGRTELTFFEPGRKRDRGVVPVAAEHDLLVMGEDVFSEAGRDLIRAVSSQHPKLPMLVIVPESRSEMAGESLAEGATGYLLTSELSGPMVRAAIAEVLREKKLETDVRRLELEDPSQRSGDPLTGLLDCELGVDFFESEFRSAVRWRSDVSCLIIRISRMDDLVQSHGQAFADLIIRNVANLLGRAVRHADVLTRLNPDEFLLVLPGTTLAQGCQRAQQILALLGAHQFALFPPALEVSVHIGVASRTESASACAADLIRFARKAVRDDVAAGARPTISVWSSLDPIAGEEG